MSEKDKDNHIAFLFSVADPRLKPEQEAHIARIGKEFCLAMAEKYTKGAIEHGGDLFDLTEDQLIEMSLEEAFDQVVYLITLREKRRAIRP